MKPPDQEPGPQLVAEWFSKAGDDLAAAETLPDNFHRFFPPAAGDGTTYCGPVDSCNLSPAAAAWAFICSLPR